MTNHYNKYKPPKLLMIFLEWFCSEKYYEEISGDLIELFQSRANKRSEFINRFLFLFDVLKFFKPYFWKTSLINFDGSLIMLQSYIKFALRNFRKHSFNSAINVIGLTIGIASILYISSYIFFEFSYDKHIDDSENIYRVVTMGSFMGKTINTVETSRLSGIVIPEGIPEIETSTLITPFDQSTITYDNNTIKESNVCASDTNFFKLFNANMIFGSKISALKNKYEVYLASSISNKLFGSANPVGKTIKLDFRNDYLIKGVYEDFPLNSHIKPRVIYTRHYSGNDNWTNFHTVFYAKLIPNANISEVQNKLDQVNEKNLAKDFQQFGIDMESFKKSGNTYTLKLQKLTDIHLHSHLTKEFEENADYQYINIFGLIGLFTLILAAVNFINLSTARSSLRAKEVGIKKVIGSTRKELISQFLTESVLISLISFVLAVILITLTFDYINNFTGIVFENILFSNYLLLPLIFILILFTGLLAGSFPAFILSAFTPIKVLRNTFTKSSKSKLRNGLVVFQFTTSIILIVGTLVVFDQLEYIQNKKLGYDKEQLLIVQDAYVAGNNLTAYKEKVKTHKNVVNGTISGLLPVGEYRSVNGLFPDGKKNDKRLLPAQVWKVDFDYIKTLGLKIVNGRDFNKDFRTDSNAIIINQACLKHFGFENPFDHFLSRGGEGNQMHHYNIIGVVEDFHFESLKENIGPLALRIGQHIGYVSFRVSGNMNEVISFAEKTWKELAPGKPFNYKFLDESFNNLYFAEVRTGKLFGIFAILAIFIASLGLLGLVAFTVERKTKEIGIRKVMGASSISVMKLMIKDFAILVVVAFVLAIPISYYILDLWLNNYAYRTNISTPVFIYAGLISFLIAVSTVIYHSLKASSLNPVDSIKYE